MDTHPATHILHVKNSIHVGGLAALEVAACGLQSDLAGLGRALTCLDPFGCCGDAHSRH
jgi:hypothetical protein